MFSYRWVERPLNTKTITEHITSNFNAIKHETEFWSKVDVIGHGIPQTNIKRDLNVLQ